MGNLQTLLEIGLFKKKKTKSIPIPITITKEVICCSNGYIYHNNNNNNNDRIAIGRKVQVNLISSAKKRPIRK